MEENTNKDVTEQTTETKEEKSLGEKSLEELYSNTAKLKMLASNKSVSKKKLLRSILNAVHGDLTDLTTTPKDNIEKNITQITENLLNLRTILLAAVIQANESNQQTETKSESEGEK